jgi:hypothetical protein
LLGGGGGGDEKLEEKNLVYPEGTFPSRKIFPSQKGAAIKFFKTHHHFFFLLSQDERKLRGGGGGGGPKKKKKKILPLRSSFQAVAYFWKCPTHGALPYLFQECPESSRIISPTRSFHHPLGLAGCTLILSFPSGYNNSYKLSLILHE